MASETPLRISGLTRFSSVDYPGCVAAVIYLDRRAIPAERLAWREVAEWL